MRSHVQSPVTRAAANLVQLALEGVADPAAVLATLTTTRERIEAQMKRGGQRMPTDDPRTTSNVSSGARESGVG